MLRDFDLSRTRKLFEAKKLNNCDCHGFSQTTTVESRKVKEYDILNVHSGEQNPQWRGMPRSANMRYAIKT